MCARSASRERRAAARGRARAGSASACRNSMSDARMVRPGADSAARDTVLSSSRMLPGQRIRRAAVERLAREHLGVDRQAVGGAVARQEALRQHRDVDLPLAQRRQADGERVDAVVQVLAEAALAHELLERRGWSPRSAGSRPRSTRLPPSRSNRRSSSTRSSLACATIDRSPISSRNSVPSLASSSRPGLRSCAPVNAPFSWPKISDSNSVSGSAAQLTAWNLPVPRRLSSWIIRATTSLPDPVGPRISTEMSDLAAVRIHSKTTSIFSSRPIISRKRWTDGDWSSWLTVARRSRKSSSRRADDLVLRAARDVTRRRAGHAL